MELFLITIAYLSGILMGLYLKKGIALFVVFCPILLILRKKNKYLKLYCTNKYMFLFLICVIVSFIQVVALEKNFNEKYKNMQEEIEVIGTIVSNVKEEKYVSICNLKVERVNGNLAYKNTMVKLHIKKQKGAKNYKYGDKISFFGNFEYAEGKRNDGGFDYREYLKTQGIYGIINSNSKDIKLIKENNTNIINLAINNIRNQISRKAKELFEENEANILNAILIGDKEELEEETREVFRRSNLSHMMAVSGAHASYVIMAVGVIVSKIKISKNKGKITTIIILIFFMYLTGKTPSVTRACIMSIYMIVSSLVHKRVNVISSMSISLLYIMIINPYSILDIGLELSYGGTIGIVFLYKILKNNEKSENKFFQKLKVKLKETILLSLSANIIIFPIVLYHFNTMSLVFLLSNLLASPFLGIIIILGFSTIIVAFVNISLAKLPAAILNICIKLFLGIAEVCSNMPFSQIYLPKPKIYLIIIYYLVILFFIFYKKIKSKSIKRRIEKIFLNKFNKSFFKRLILILFIFIFLFTLYNKIPKDLKIYFIDVGQGDSTLIITPMQKTILIDGGGKEDYDVGKNILIPYLLNKGIVKLDYIIISHFDTDHIRAEF